ncbi:MAG: HAD family hydrolase [Gammaproteobacteria bacterium]|nr:HAD family hydrolase [Gammaproteobacteria bacterium]
MPTRDATESHWPPLRAVLFDLDGTLLDTAPDLAGALNYLRERHHLSPLDALDIRPAASHGSVALIKLGFGLNEGDQDFEPLRQALLAHYRDRIAEATRPFMGVIEVIAHLRNRGLLWGIVTNKPGWLTTPLLAQVDLGALPECVVAGDTLATTKPDPAPLLHAAKMLGVAATECVYIGDAERDITAGNRAGMRTLVALYGYLDASDAPHTWGSSDTLQAPLDLIQWLDRQSARGDT